MWFLVCENVHVYSDRIFLYQNEIKIIKQNPIFVFISLDYWKNSM